MQTIHTGAAADHFESNGRSFTRAASVAELEQRPFKVVTLEDRHILLLRADGQIRALDSRCPHMGYPLSQGTIKDGVLRCHWHHWRFDLASGDVLPKAGTMLPYFLWRFATVRSGSVQRHWKAMCAAASTSSWATCARAWKNATPSSSPRPLQACAPMGFPTVTY